MVLLAIAYNYLHSASPVGTTNDDAPKIDIFELIQKSVTIAFEINILSFLPISTYAISAIKL